MQTRERRRNKAWLSSTELLGEIQWRHRSYKFEINYGERGGGGLYHVFPKQDSNDILPPPRDSLEDGEPGEDVLWR